jgi:hypothetical protein
VDGNIRNPVEGGTGQNFSRSSSEFQLSTNFDLSTGITAFGAIIVTCGGGNEYHGAYFYSRSQYGGLIQPGSEHDYR